LFVGKIGHAFGHIFRPALGQYRHTVIRFLSVENRVIPSLFNGGEWKLRIFEFEFLQAQRIRLMRLQPIKHMWQTDVQRIDIPGGKFHKAGFT
jgi:hypothetical protein